MTPSLFIVLLTFFMSVVMVAASIEVAKDRYFRGWLVFFVPLAIAFFLLGVLGIIFPTLYVN